MLCELASFVDSQSIRRAATVIVASVGSSSKATLAPSRGARYVHVSRNKIFGEKSVNLLLSDRNGRWRQSTRRFVPATGGRPSPREPSSGGSGSPARETRGLLTMNVVARATGDGRKQRGGSRAVSLVWASGRYRGATAGRRRLRPAIRTGVRLGALAEPFCPPSRLHCFRSRFGRRCRLSDDNLVWAIDLNRVLLVRKFDRRDDPTRVVRSKYRIECLGVDSVVEGRM